MQNNWITTNVEKLDIHKVYEAEFVNAWDDTGLEMFVVRFYCPELDSTLHYISNYKNRDKQKAEIQFLNKFRVKHFGELERLQGTTWYLTRLSDYDGYIYVIKQKKNNRKQFKPNNSFQVRRDEFGCPVF